VGDETEVQALDDKGAAPIVVAGVEIDGRKLRRGLANVDYGYQVLQRLGQAWTGTASTAYALTDQVLARCKMLAREVLCRSAGRG
jgi:hypothetical protein